MSDRQAHVTATPRTLPAVREGIAGFLVLVSTAAAVAIAATAMLARETGEPVILLLLGTLAVFGAFFLLAASVGLVRIDGAQHQGLLLAGYLEATGETVEIRSREGAILERGSGLVRLLDELGAPPESALEDVLEGLGGSREAIYRLVRAAGAGAAHSEELELPLVGPECGGPATVAVSVTPLGDGLSLVWRLRIAAAVASDEPDLEEEIGAAQLLDRLPAGILQFGPDGGISFLNRTLGDWSRVEPGKLSLGLTLADLLGAEAAETLLDLHAGGDRPAAVLELSADLLSAGKAHVPVTILASAPAAVGGQAMAIVMARVAEDHAAVAAHAAPLAAPIDGDARFARFFEAAPIAIATVHRDGRVASANAEFDRMFERPRGRAGRKVSLLDLVSADSRDEVRALLSRDRAPDAGTELLDPAHAPIDIMFGGGKSSGRLYVGSAVTDAGEAPQIVVYAINTTKQKELELQFAQSQKMQAIGQLAGGIAHDFNNVLTVIFTACDLLLLSHRSSDPAFRDIIAIKQNANRAAGLVRQLLAFSRRQTLRPEVLSLNDVVSDLNVFLSRLLGEKTKLKVSHGRDLWMVKADVTQFEQVIINLAVNARDAMPSGGRLSIRTTNIGNEEVQTLDDKGMEPADYVLCEVSDTGSGMSAEVLEKIFEPFFSTKEVGKGTGLGLSTVYGIVKQTGGYIYVDSVPGKGTTFRIYLPRHLQGASAAAQPVRNEKKDRPRDLTGTGTVLLVEDEEAVRRFAGLALKRQGYQVLEAGTGVEALEVMERNEGRINLVVSDIVMPEMDGPTMLKELRKRNPTLKIIFISGYAEDALKSLDEGEEFAFLPKPFQLKDLVQKVKETLEEA